jgi:hypothetical protein
VSLRLNGEFDLDADLRLDNAYEARLFAEGGVIKQLMRSVIGRTKRSPDGDGDVVNGGAEAVEVKV